MTLDTDIYTALMANVALQAIVAGRNYSAQPPPEAIASGAVFIHWQETTGEPTPTLDTFGTDAGHVTVQFSCWAGRLGDAKAARAALATTLAAAFPGAMAATNPGTYQDPDTRKFNAVLFVRFFTAPV